MKRLASQALRTSLSLPAESRFTLRTVGNSWARLVSVVRQPQTMPPARKLVCERQAWLRRVDGLGKAPGRLAHMTELDSLTVATDGKPLPEPLALFRTWYANARVACPLNHPGVVCLSTVDEHGAPEGRFVDLKLLSERGFVFGTHLHSGKARALALNPNVAMTFWWDHVERQVRIIGRAERLPRAQENALFANRSRDAQVASWASQQSTPLHDVEQFERRLDEVRHRFAGVDVPRPDHWGGYCVVPTRIEFLAFRASRLHDRVLFERDSQGWQRSMLQP